MILAALSWRGVELWPVALAAVALLTAALMFLYAPQVRLLPWPWRGLLPLLRGAAMLALAVSILRPVLIGTKTVQEQGAVVLLLDRSLSMGVSDRVLPAQGGERRAILGQLVALADGLGRLQEGARSLAGTEVYKDIMSLEPLAEEIGRVRREVEFARLSGRASQEAENRMNRALEEFQATARRAEQSARKAGGRPIAAEQLFRTARSTRPEDRERFRREIREAVANAQRSQESIDVALYDSNEQARWVCDDLSHRSRLELCWEALAGGSGALLSRLDRKIAVAGFAFADELEELDFRDDDGELIKQVPVAAEGPASDLSGAIARSLRQLKRRPVQAVVVLSDGRQVGPERQLPAGLIPSGVPIFTVYAASPYLRDLSIERLELPQAVFVNEPMPAAVVLRTLGMPASKIGGEAHLSAAQEPPTARPIKLKDQPSPLHRLELHPVRITQPGIQKVVVSLPVQEGEANAQNNRAQRWVKVLSQKLKVAAIAGSGGWDFRYLRNTLARADWIELHAATVVPGRTALALGPEDILKQDLVILSDVAPEALTGAQWAAIRTLVADRGGSLIFVPALGHAQPPNHPLENLLPYAGAAKLAWQAWPGQNPYYHLTPAPEAAGLEALRLDEEAGAGRRWDQLPGFYRYFVLPELKAGARSLLIERHSRAPVLTESRFGSGRVFFFGMNETWRWRDTSGGQVQERFWMQLVRYAMDEPYALSRGALALDVDKLEAQPEQGVLVRARLLLSKGDANLPQELELSVEEAEQVVRTVKLSPSGSAGAGRYQALLADLPVGDYALRLLEPSPEDGVPNELTLPLTIRRSPEPELADLSGDRAALQQLADASGGKCINLEQIGALPELLEEARARQPRTSEWPLWDSAYLFVFVLACLSAEWALRKQFGLA